MTGGLEEGVIGIRRRRQEKGLKGREESIGKGKESTSLGMMAIRVGEAAGSEGSLLHAAAFLVHFSLSLYMTAMPLRQKTLQPSQQLWKFVGWGETGQPHPLPTERGKPAACNPDFCSTVCDQASAPSGRQGCVLQYVKQL